MSPVVFAGIVSVFPLTDPFVVLHDKKKHPVRVGRVRDTVCETPEIEYSVGFEEPPLPPF